MPQTNVRPRRGTSARSRLLEPLEERSLLSIGLDGTLAGSAPLAPSQPDFGAQAANSSVQVSSTAGSASELGHTGQIGWIVLLPDTGAGQTPRGPGISSSAGESNLAFASLTPMGSGGFSTWNPGTDVTLGGLKGATRSLDLAYLPARYSLSRAVDHSTESIAGGPTWLSGPSSSSSEAFLVGRMGSPATAQDRVSLSNEVASGGSSLAATLMIWSSPGIAAMGSPSLDGSSGSSTPAPSGDLSVSSVSGVADKSASSSNWGHVDPQTILDGFLGAIVSSDSTPHPPSEDPTDPTSSTTEGVSAANSAPVSGSVQLNAASTLSVRGLANLTAHEVLASTTYGKPVGVSPSPLTIISASETSSFSIVALTASMASNSGDGAVSSRSLAFSETEATPITTLPTGTSALALSYQAASKSARSVLQLPGRWNPGDNAWAGQRSGDPPSDSAQDAEPLMAEAAQNLDATSRADDLYARFSPFDRDALDRAIDDFLGDIRTLAGDPDGAEGVIPVMPGVVAAVFAISAVETIRRRFKKPWHDVPTDVHSDGESSYPGLPLRRGPHLWGLERR